MHTQIYFGGTILTMEEPLVAEAVLVQDGQIVQVGSLQEVRASGQADTRMVDLKGKTLLPAFIDPHGHITAFASTLQLAPLEGARDFAEVVQRLRDYGEANPLKKGDWIIGFGYDHNQLAESRHPGRTLLDQVSAEHPVLITHKSGHMGVLNTAALRAAGVTAKTPDPEGGRIGREPDGKTPNGYLEETAFIRCASEVPAPSREEMLRLLEKAQQVYLQYGIATAQEGKMQRQEYEVLRAAADSGRLSIDVAGYADMQACPGLVEENRETVGVYHGGFKLGGYKIFLDGSPQGRTAWLSQPYEGAEDGYRGYPVYQDGQVRAFVQKSVAEGVQLLAHCNGDAAADQLLQAFEQVCPEKDRAAALRPVMIHAQTLRPDDQLDRARQFGMIPSFFVAHTWFWGDVHLKNLGRRRAERISPAASAARRGMAFTFHQDTPVVPPDMLFTVWCAVNRVTKDGARLGAEECVSPLEALRAVTIYAAYQYFEEEQKGSIRAGKQADFVVLDRNPLAVPPETIKDIQVVATIKNGEALYRRA